MAFTPIINGSGKRWQATPRVRFYANGRSSKQAVVSVTRPILDMMEWSIGDRILVSLGIGEDIGRFSLMRVKSGGQKLCSTSSANLATIGFTLPDQIGAMDRAAFSEWVSSSKDPCHFVQNGKNLVITVAAANRGVFAPQVNVVDLIAEVRRQS